MWLNQKGRKPEPWETEDEHEKRDEGNSKVEGMPREPLVQTGVGGYMVSREMSSKKKKIKDYFGKIKL